MNILKEKNWQFLFGILYFPKFIKMDLKGSLNFIILIYVLIIYPIEINKSFNFKNLEN